MMDIRRIEGGEICGLETEELTFLERCMTGNNAIPVWNQWTGLPSTEKIQLDVDLSRLINANEVSKIHFV
jgi:hypothetical protein